MTTPDDSQKTRSASSGATRTPPPRTRRGAPTSRSSFDDLDALDDLLLPEQKAALVEPVEDAPTKSTRGTRGAKPSGAKSSGAKSGTRGAPAGDGDDPVAATGSAPAKTKRAKSTGTRGAPKTSEPAYDWDKAEPEPTRARKTTTNRDATIAATTAAELYGDPVEPEVAFEPAPAARPAKAKSAKRPERRFRQTVQKIDLWSVTKMALCFYVSAMGVVIVSLVALWVVADSAGIIDNVETFIGDLFSSENFHFVSGQVLRGAVLGAVVLVALMVAFTIIAASFYNIFAELFGGIEVVIREEEQPPKR